MDHELKTWPSPFQAVLDGKKTYEFRRNDRNFMVGDRLWLREWDNVGETYTGRSAVCVVSYMTDGVFGVPEGFAVLALKNVTKLWTGHAPVWVRDRMLAEKEAPVSEKTCGTCLHRCMDMTMDPYCAAPEILKDWPLGKNLCRGRPEQCGPEGKLWVLDTRREKTEASGG